MPLSEFYRMGNGKIENTQQKATDISFLPDNEFVELVWENGQIMMQGQSNKSRKSPISSRFQYHTPKLRDKDMGNATASKTGKFGAMESIFNDIDLSVPSGELGLGQDDDIVPWLNYPVGDNLQHDYCSELLPELSGVTVNDHPSNRNSYASVDKRECCNQTVRNSHNGVGLEQGNASNLSLSRAAELYPWSLQQGKASIPSLGSGVSDLISSNATNNLCGDSVVGDFAHTNTQNQDSAVPSSNPSLLNFSHFLRPAATARPNLQTVVDLAGSGSSGVEKMGDKDKRSVVASSSKSTLNDPNSGLQKEMGFYNQPNLASTKVDSIALVTNPLEESRPAEQSDAVCQLDGVKNDKSPNQALGGSTSKGVLVLESEKTVEPVVASSSVCSANSAERVSDDPTNNLKRKCRDSEESEWQSDDVDEELTGVKRASSARGGAGSKRTRAAEVHNLSERRRRDRINEKMRALQELIPNCNKVDKASMLDEAIEYLKTLQLQVQIMSMGAGLYMPHMMLPPGMQHIHAAHLPHFSPMGIGMGMGMGFGMGMVDMNRGSRGFPMYPVPPMQGSHFPSPPFPGPTTFQGVGGSNCQVFGHPGQVLPMTVSGSPLVPLSAQPPINSAMGLNASRMGVHLDVSNAAASLNSKDLIHTADASCSMNQTSSQFQATKVGFDQSALVPKNDHAPDVGGSAAVQSSNANDTVPSRAAGSD